MILTSKWMLKGLTFLWQKNISHGDGRRKEVILKSDKVAVSPLTGFYGGPVLILSANKELGCFSYCLTVQ